MAHGSRKFLQIWSLLIIAVLAIPFQRFLETNQYKSANEFFEEILPWVVFLGAIFILPFAAFTFRRRKRKRQSSLQNKNNSQNR